MHFYFQFLDNVFLYAGSILHVKMCKKLYMVVNQEETPISHHTLLFVEPRDLTINIFQFDFVLFVLNLFFFTLLLNKCISNIYVYMYAYV